MALALDNTDTARTPSHNTHTPAGHGLLCLPCRSPDHLLWVRAAVAGKVSWVSRRIRAACWGRLGASRGARLAGCLRLFQGARAGAGAWTYLIGAGLRAVGVCDRQRPAAGADSRGQEEACKHRGCLLCGAV
jgi:hypothetical protein